MSQDRDYQRAVERANNHVANDIRDVARLIYKSAQYLQHAEGFFAASCLFAIEGALREGHIEALSDHVEEFAKQHYPARWEGKKG